MQPRRLTLIGLAGMLVLFALGLVLPGLLTRGSADPVLSSGIANMASTASMDNSVRQMLAPDAVADERCGPGLIYLPELDSCTHGPDPAPTGLDVDRRVSTLGLKDASVHAASLACDGDGETGPRVQLLYVLGAQQASRYAAVAPSIQAWAAEADQIYQDSAARTGGSRQIRFVHDYGCAPVVYEARVSVGAMANFSTMASELRNQGFNRKDRLYLTFVDTTAAGICGIASIRNDDQPGVGNANNVGPSFARVDAGCWSGQVAAHELMHNLGGVQHSAPNASLGFHCTDENDVMCYRDSPYYPTMRTVCKQSSYQRLLDCNNEDYFNTAPPPGSYLATHWNPANNRFLIKGPDDPNGYRPLDDTLPTGRLVLPKAVTGGKRVAVTARVSDNAKVSEVAFGICRGKRCSWESARPLGTDRGGPFRAVWKAPKRGTYTIIARVVDSSENVRTIKKTVTIKPAKKSAKQRAKQQGMTREQKSDRQPATSAPKKPGRR